MARMNDLFESYAKLLGRAKEIALLDSTASLLSWDQETCMPAKGVAFRAEQLAHLGGLSHRLFTAPEVGDWLKASEDQGFAPGSKEAANLREWRRCYDRQTRLPAHLVEDFQRATSLAREAWAEARRRSFFPLFRPHLEEILELSRHMADCWGYEDSRYDALLEGFERGARTRHLRVLFGDLRPALEDLLLPALRRSEGIPADFLDGDYPVAGQQAFNREVATAMGFDFEAGRIDATTHPFCSGLGPRDCRLTTRYNERNFTQSLYSVMHETGHGLYDQGLPISDYGTPSGAYVSLGIHESQSRLWENQVGRSRGFWEFWYPRARRHLPSLERFTPEQVHRAVNRVAPSLIRVEADQVTYDLHIILRFEIELKLVEEEIRPADLPALWDEEFEKMFGLEVPRDAAGCLQDIHWSMGSFGYFPTYTLGNLNASQLMRRVLRDKPDLEVEMSHGRYARLLRWLRQRIHSQGQRLSPDELMAKATGEPTQVRYHLEYLRRKYGPGAGGKEQRAGSGEQGAGSKE